MGVTSILDLTHLKIFDDHKLKFGRLVFEMLGQGLPLFLTSDSPSNMVAGIKQFLGGSPDGCKPQFTLL